MADLEKFLKFQYNVIDIIDESAGIYLVQDVISGRVFRKRTVTFEEARIFDLLKQVRNPYLINVEGVYYLENEAVVIEEYVNGWTLQTLIEQHGTFSKELSEKYIRQICSAIRELHIRNIVHRNLTPDNIIVTMDGIIKVDNSCAIRKIDRNKIRDTVFMGTTGYAAPEQFGFSQSDCRADVYSIGVLLNIMLTGHLPVDGVYSSSKKLKSIIVKCISIDKNKRFNNVDDLVHEFDRSRNGYYLQKFYRQLPGIRSDKWYCKLFAFGGYLTFFFYLFGIIEMVFLEEGITKFSCLELVGVLSFEWIIPWALASNVGNYSVRLLGLDTIPAPARMCVNIVLGVMFWVFGFFLEAAFV